MQEFSNLLLVLGVTVAVATSICMLYATGLCLWSKSRDERLTTASLVGDPSSAQSGTDPLQSQSRYRGNTTPTASNAMNVMTRLGAALCFAGCIAIVLYALWLMIPLFH